MPPMPKRTAALIRTDADVRRGIRALRRACPTLKRLHDQTGDPPVRHVGHGFEGLSRIIVGQQLSVASASAIWNRTRALIEPFEPKGLSAAADAELRSAGLSAGKVRTLRALARACAEEGLDIAALDALDETAIRERLMRVSGIGPWTADIYVMFCLGRADSWAPGDLALQVAAGMAFALEARPGPAELEALAERWRPWRGVAARVLWAWYGLARHRSSAEPL